MPSTLQERVDTQPSAKGTFSERDLCIEDSLPKIELETISGKDPEIAQEDIRANILYLRGIIEDTKKPFPQDYYHKHMTIGVALKMLEKENIELNGQIRYNQLDELREMYRGLKSPNNNNYK